MHRIQCHSNWQSVPLHPRRKDICGRNPSKSVYTVFPSWPPKTCISSRAVPTLPTMPLKCHTAQRSINSKSTNKPLLVRQLKTDIIAIIIDINPIRGCCHLWTRQRSKSDSSFPSHHYHLSFLFTSQRLYFGMVPTWRVTLFLLYFLGGNNDGLTGGIPAGILSIDSANAAKWNVKQTHAWHVTARGLHVALAE